MVVPSYVLAAVVALLVSHALVPMVRRLARRVGAVDMPGGRRINRRPIPRLGGLAMYAGFVGALLLAIPLSRPIEVTRSSGLLVIKVPVVPSADLALLGILVGGTLITLVGAVDDVRGMRPGLKFLLQILCAAVLIPFGLSTLFVTNPFSGILYLGRLGTVVTIFWVVAFTNVMNFIDGVDGLAAGIGAIGSGVLFVAASQRGDVPVMLMAMALGGSCLGFLRHNFNPARIFMGDSGSMFVGYVLGAISVMGLYKSVAAISLFVPILALGVPILDAAYAIVRRYRSGQPIYLPDRGHLHHRLLDRGLTQRQTVLLLYLVSAFFGVGALVVAGVNRTASVITLGIIAAILYVGARRMGLLDRRPAARMPETPAPRA
ncbi:MAG: undecaprenyl/decaprenyl-phosphate alpha-N-acetylglucosaminyl 1-phosphate transferase [Armatimonadetes bacterium]|nr:undecaprenyl/decaprenyl-phosphate alpha-N-acetylglucosaminyl 1-phosphate transferase [Armatimonadota bacterium]